MGAVAMSYITITNIIGAIVGVVLAVIIKPGECLQTTRVRIVQCLQTTRVTIECVVGCTHMLTEKLSAPLVSVCVCMCVCVCVRE